MVPDGEITAQPGRGDPMNRCKICVMPDTRPDTPFTSNGVCSACISHGVRDGIDWTARRRELEALLETGKNGTGYDCVVASSGGKDSHFIALTLLQLGARPLIVTATTCHLTGLGRANIDNLARYATTIEVTANRQTRAKLNLAGLNLVGDISWPEHASIFTVPFRIAGSLGIPLIFYGECPQEAYGGPAGTETAKRMDGRWVSEFGGFLGLRATDLVGESGLDKRDLEDYRLPRPEIMDRTSAYFLGQFIRWDSHENAAKACAFGFKFARPSRANLWAWENLDNAQTGLHDHMMYRKYGYGRLCAQASVDIRFGRITRGLALHSVLRLDGLFPDVYAGVPIEDVIAPLGLTMDELDKIMNNFTNWDLFRGVYWRRPLLKGE